MVFLDKFVIEFWSHGDKFHFLGPIRGPAPTIRGLGCLFSRGATAMLSKGWFGSSFACDWGWFVGLFEL